MSFDAHNILSSFMSFDCLQRKVGGHLLNKINKRVSKMRCSSFCFLLLAVFENANWFWTTLIYNLVKERSKNRFFKWMKMGLPSWHKNKQQLRVRLIDLTMRSILSGLINCCRMKFLAIILVLWSFYAIFRLTDFSLDHLNFRPQKTG